MRLDKAAQQGKGIQRKATESDAAAAPSVKESIMKTQMRTLAYVWKKFRYDRAGVEHFSVKAYFCLDAQVIHFMFTFFLSLVPSHLNKTIKAKMAAYCHICVCI